MPPNNCLSCLSTSHSPFRLQGNTEAEGGGPRKKRRTNYSYIPEDVKKKVVDYAKIHGTRPAARLFNISEGTIRSWKMRGFNKPTPTIARGRKVTYGQDLDNELYLGLMAMISEQEIITVDQFTEYAKKIIVERRPDLNFKCSRGWIDKFLSRHKLGVTKSDAAKVMHIVEQSEVVKHSSKSMSSSLYHQPKDTYFATADESSEMSLAMAQPGTQDSPPPGLERHDSSENGSLTPLTDKAPSGYNSYLPSEEVTEALSEKEQKKQRDAAKSMHVRDIMGKLDEISGSSGRAGNGAGNIDEQQHLEIVRHAHLHGSKSAEKKYGVPETTVNYWLQKTQLSNEQAMAAVAAAKKMPVPLEHTLVVQGSRVTIPNKNIIIAQGGSLPPPANKHHVYVKQGATNVPVSNKPAYVTHGMAMSEQAFIVQGEGVPVQKEQTFVVQGGGLPMQKEQAFLVQGPRTSAHNDHTFVVQGSTQAHEEVYVTQASKMATNISGNQRHGPPQLVLGTDPAPTAAIGETEMQVLLWALEQKRNGQEVTFDGLCDQALCYISQDNPSSAYSSTRKWVDQFLNLKVRNLLNVKM